MSVPSQLTTEQLISELMRRQQKPQAPVEIVVRHLRQQDHEFKDSITIGTPGRGGEVKIYFDSGAAEEEINRRIDSAFRARGYAQLKLSESSLI
ncbi:hypothetical protein [Methanocella sp. MCL-LM]|uniref:hypothetical protein n=1 Tax=Methanocella sp. MCL-LM TaxID=3412035 RepID=UPI003C795886